MSLSRRSQCCKGRWRAGILLAFVIFSLILLCFVEMPKEKWHFIYFPLLMLSQQAPQSSHEVWGRPSRAVWKRLYQPLSTRARTHKTLLQLSARPPFFMIQSSWNGLTGSVRRGKKRELLSPCVWADANFSPRAVNKREEGFVINSAISATPKAGE